MLEIFSVDQCKKMDYESINNIGIPGIILMENAARSIFEEISWRAESFLILCGKGNNGGDALALARHLANDSKKVKVYIISNNENFTDDFKINFKSLKNILNESDISFIKCKDDVNESFIKDLKGYDLVVDGIFGVGLNRDLEGMFKDAIDSVNENSRFVVSIDTPSGLDCNSGIIRGSAVRADLTCTFEVIKQGFLNYKAIDCLGELKVLNIGIPKKIKNLNTCNIYRLEKDDYKKIVPQRNIYGHKGNYGRALIVAGSKGFTGAAFITTECTVRSGAGLTTLISSEYVQNVVSEKLVEAMTVSFSDNRVKDLIAGADSIAFGPGIGTTENELKLLKMVIEDSKCPIVLDADGITLIGNDKSLLSKLRGRAVLTPHPGEMARFLNLTVEQVEKDRVNIAKRVAEEYEIVVLLKGYNTVISDGKTTYINPTGNSKMASGGMGDALTGIINSFVSQGISLINSTLLGAYIHGDIADKLSKEVYIVNARDIINELPKEINDIIHV